MSASKAKQDGSRRRRSPRVAQAFPVTIAGRGADGSVFVESTRTCDISKYGASLTTEHPCAIGAPLAIRRAGAKPMRARVVAAKPGPQSGSFQLGVEFVGEETTWDLEFPQEWQDDFDAAAEQQKQAAPWQQAQAQDASLERVIKKAEFLRGQAEAMLQEFAAQVEAARQEGIRTLALQLDLLTSQARDFEAKLAGQVEISAEAVRVRAEKAQSSLVQDSVRLEEKFAALKTQWDAALRAGEEQYQQILTREGQKAVRLVAQAAGQLEGHRKALGELENQAARWRKEAAGLLTRLREDTDRLLHNTRAELTNAALTTVKEVRKRIPELVEETDRSLKSLFAEQKTAAAQWVEESLQTIRAGLAELETESKATQVENARQALEQYSIELQKRLAQARALGETQLAPLEERLQRAKDALDALAGQLERTVSGAGEELESAAARQQDRLREATVQRLTEIDGAMAKALARLEEVTVLLQARSKGALRKLEEGAREMEQRSADLSQNADQKRAELETFFASLMANYNSRMEALDRLLQTLESGRGALRADLESLKSCAQENEARLAGLASERVAALQSRTVELQRELETATRSLEAGLKERAAAALEPLQGSFAARLEEDAQQLQRKFQGVLDGQLARAEERLAEMVAALERSAEQQSQALLAAAADHAKALAVTLQEAEARAAEGVNRLTRCAAEAEEALQHAAAAATGAVEDRQAKAVVAIGELFSEVQEARASLARENAQIDNQARQRQQVLDAHFAGLSSRVEDKRAVLESFFAQIERAKAALAQSMASLEQQVEKGRSALYTLQRETEIRMEKNAAALAQRLQEQLEQPILACQREMEAVGEATQEVFRARIQALAEEALNNAVERIERTGDRCAMSMQEEFRKHERNAKELAQQYEAVLLETRRTVRESVAAAAASLHEQIEQVCRTAVERVKQEQETALQELLTRAAEAEQAFRESLEGIRESQGQVEPDITAPGLRTGAGQEAG